MDTIAAISTPIGESGIGIVRLSGDKAIAIADEIFIGKCKPSETKSHTILYGKIFDGNKIIDEVLLMLMRKPNTYTGEDIVEINAHGSPLILKKILNLVINKGARLSEPGEFTRRAFLNGRIDLSQAEATLSLIKAKTEKSLSIAIQQLFGKFSKEMNKLKENLINVKMKIEAMIDFPEDVEEIEIEEIHKEINEINNVIKKIINESERALPIQQGISVPIVGRPNVGKSSLFNRLLSQDRSIVTPYPGTTRDTIEGWCNINGIPVKLIDTAGVLETTNPIEIESVKRTKNAIADADILIFVFDVSDGVVDDDLKLLNYINSKKIICVGNKCDLPNKEIKIDLPFIKVSAIYGTNIDLLCKKISETAECENIDEIVCNERQIIALKKASNFIENALKLKNYELISYELGMAIDSIKEIIGEITSEDILDKIFSNFCIGK